MSRRPVPLESQEHLLPLPASRRTVHPLAAPDWLLTVTAEEPVTLVATGPLTNVAAALTLDPAMASRVERLVVMGGTRAVRTSVTPWAERNTWNDPWALDAVLGAGFASLTLVTLDATYDALMGPADVAALAALGTPLGDAAAAFVAERVEDYAEVVSLGGRAPVHDPLTVGLLVDPGLAHGRTARVTVELEDPERFGQTRIDTGAAEPNAEVVLGCDGGRLAALLLDRLS